MDKLTWFKFSPSDWIMGKISKMPLKIQAEYLRFICIYWNKGCIVSKEDALLYFSDQAWEKLNEFKLLNINDGYVSILFLSSLLSNLILSLLIIIVTLLLSPVTHFKPSFKDKESNVNI